MVMKGRWRMQGSKEGIRMTFSINGSFVWNFAAAAAAAVIYCTAKRTQMLMIVTSGTMKEKRISSDETKTSDYDTDKNL